MKIIETHSREIVLFLWGHCQNILDDPRIDQNITILTARYTMLCTRRLQPTRDDCTVRVQSTLVCKGKLTRKPRQKPINKWGMEFHSQMCIAHPDHHVSRSIRSKAQYWRMNTQPSTFGAGATA